MASGIVPVRVASSRWLLIPPRWRRSAVARKHGYGCKWPTTWRRPASMKARLRSNGLSGGSWKSSAREAKREWRSRLHWAGVLTAAAPTRRRGTAAGHGGIVIGWASKRVEELLCLPINLGEYLKTHPGGPGRQRQCRRIL